MKYFEADEKFEENLVEATTSSSSYENKPWTDNDTVEVLFLEMVPAIPTKEWKDYLEKERDKERKFKLSGINYVSPEIDYKKLGIAWRYVVTKYQKPGKPAISTLSYEPDGKVILPKYSVFGRIQQPNPSVYLNNKTLYEQKLGMNSGTHEHPNLGYFPASTSPASMKAEYKGVTKDWKISDIDMNDPEDVAFFEKMLSANNARIEVWKEYIADYEGFGYNQAVNNLQHRLSRRYFVCDYDAEQMRWRYGFIEPGMTLQLGIRKSKYLDVAPFYWDSVNSKHVFFAYQNVMGDYLWVGPSVTNENIELANRILKQEKDDEIPF